MNGCCGTCKYGHYDKMQGYVCVNDESEYIADFVEYEHWCEDWVSKNYTHTWNDRKMVHGLRIMFGSA